MPYLSADCIRSAAKAENLMDGMQFADNGTQIEYMHAIEKNQMRPDSTAKDEQSIKPSIIDKLSQPNTSQSPSRRTATPPKPPTRSSTPPTSLPSNGAPEIYYTMDI